MASYNELNALIDAYINRNGVQAITGQILNGVLKAMVEQLGRGYTIMGAAIPTTDPGTPDAPESYFASQAGTYTKFGGIAVASTELCLLCYTPGAGWDKRELFPGIQSVNASIDEEIPFPSVDVTYNNGVLSFDFHSIIGEKGDPGIPADISDVFAQVDANIGTPSVDVTIDGPSTGREIYFKFHNLKGETGVTSVLATVDNTVGTPQCAVSLEGQQLTLAFSGLKGAQGDTGSSVDYPFTIVNNLTTDDATQALSAAQGVVLDGKVSQLEAKVDDFEGVTIVENGNTGNPSNTQSVRTRVVGRHGARYAIIRITRPNAPGCHYGFGFALTSSVDDIGSSLQFASWVGGLLQVNLSSTQTNTIIDLINNPTAVGIAISIAEYDANGNMQTLRKTDFSNEQVSLICDVRAEEVYKTESSMVLNEMNLLSIPNIDGYINGSGGYNSNASYKTCFVERTAFGEDTTIIGMVDFLHFYDINKTWMSCLKSWASGNGMIRVKRSDIPLGCVYVALCFKNDVSFIHLFDTRTYISRQNVSPFTPFFRYGNLRYSGNGVGLTTALIIPTYNASAIRLTINKDAGEGYYYRIYSGVYPTISDEISVTNDRAYYYSGISVNGNVAYVRTEGVEGVGFQIDKMDSNGTAQALAKNYFADGDVTVERLFVPEELKCVMNYDAYARNRDKDAMLAASVRMNKVGNGSMDFLSLIIADSHRDTVAEDNAVMLANEFQYVQALIHTGDFSSDDQSTFSAAQYAKMVGCKKPFYFVAGNHDVGNSKDINKCITTSQYYSRYISPLVDAGLLVSGEYTENDGYYYHDFTEKKIRLICIYEYDGPDDVNPTDNTKYTYRHGESIISKAQAQWFCGVLNSTPADYGIIVAMHNPFSALADCVTTAKFNDPDWVDGYGKQRLFSTDLWADIVDAWVNKSANYHCSMVCTGDASYLNDGGEYYSFDYDFSGRNNTAKFLCFIGGHGHRDCVWRHRIYRYQYQITPICANTTNYAQCPSADIRRTPTDGPSKDSLTAIGYDKDNQAIRLVKLGVNVTENMVARDYELIKTQEP